MRWCFDIDGVITANPQVFSWLTYHLKKKENSNYIIILSSRDPKRREETEKYLENIGIIYDQLYLRPEHLGPDWGDHADWKLYLIRDKIKPDVWFDNDFKMYERVLKIDLNLHVPKSVERIQI